MALSKTHFQRLNEHIKEYQAYAHYVLKTGGTHFKSLLKKP